MRRRTIVIILLLSLFIVVPLIFWGISISKQTSSDGSVIRDRDTGEVYDSRENNVQTGGSGVQTGPAVLFGIEPLTKELISQKKGVGYIDSVKQALWDFNTKRADGKLKSITLQPKGLTYGTKTITGTIRLDQSDTTLPITITPSRTNAAAIVAINEKGSSYDGTYVYVGKIDVSQNLLFTIKQKDTRSTDLIIDTYEGYREAALKYIESIGYSVSDFKIEFTNYTSPF